MVTVDVVFVPTPLPKPFLQPRCAIRKLHFTCFVIIL